MGLVKLSFTVAATAAITFWAVTSLDVEQRVNELEQRVDVLEYRANEQASQPRPQPRPQPQQHQEPTPQITVVHTGHKFDHVNLDRFCLAKNIYHEARGESLLGQYAVAQVTLNRVLHSRWPNDICHVVMQPAQFSWTNDRSRRWTHPNDAAWTRAQQVAADVLDRGARVRGLESALFYHTDWVQPNWKDPQHRITQIDAHVFYAADRRR